MTHTPFPFPSRGLSLVRSPKQGTEQEFLSMGLSTPDVSVMSHLIYGNRLWKMGNEQSVSEEPTQVKDAELSCSTA